MHIFPPSTPRSINYYWSLITLFIALKLFTRVKSQSSVDEIKPANNISPTFILFLPGPDYLSNDHISRSFQLDLLMKKNIIVSPPFWRLYKHYNKYVLFSLCLFLSPPSSSLQYLLRIFFFEAERGGM